MVALKGVHTLIAGTCKYVTIHGKKKKKNFFSKAIKGLDIGRLSLFMWVNPV